MLGLLVDVALENLNLLPDVGDDKVEDCAEFF